MAFNSKTDIVSWLVVFTVLLLLIEVTFFDGGLLFSLGLSGLLLYYGKKRIGKKRGKLALLIGGIGVLVTVLNMFAFKLLLLSLLGLAIYKFFDSKKHPAYFAPQLTDEGKAEEIRVKPLLLSNRLVGSQSTGSHIYEWEDINIQTGIGDVVVDLGNTVLPKGENIVSVRNIAGTIRVFVPYGIEVKVVHSVLAGKISILANPEQRLFNQCVQYHTDQYASAGHKIKIITSTVAGNIEVVRI
ncbi:MAG: cell wall-active antibiotics response protein LiaF [Bacillus sp. (in: firmicutes)]